MTDLDIPPLLGSTQLLGVLPGAYLGPVLAAFLLTALTGGRAGLRAWGRRLWRWRVSWRWYAVALLSVPLAVILTSTVLAGGEVHAPSVLVLAAYVPSLLVQMVTTGLAEEPGWRDFALPRLQRGWGPLGSVLVLGPLWGVWHLPLFLTEWGGWPDASCTRPLEFMAFCVAFNVVMTWFFNRTSESLPLSMLLHVSVNTFMSLVWSEMFPTLDPSAAQRTLLVASTVAAVALLVATRGRLGYPRTHDAAPDQGDTHA